MTGKIQSVIEVVDFHKSFGGKKVHQGVSFYVRKGECLGLIGGSGTGKSVLLRSLVGLEKPDHGQILIDGTDVAPLREAELIEIRKKVAYVFQDGALFDSMTVYENLAYPLREHFQLNEREIAQKIQQQLHGFLVGRTLHNGFINQIFIFIYRGISVGVVDQQHFFNGSAAHAAAIINKIGDFG